QRNEACQKNDETAFQHCSKTLLSLEKDRGAKSPPKESQRWDGSVRVREAARQHDTETAGIGGIPPAPRCPGGTQRRPDVQIIHGVGSQLAMRAPPWRPLRGIIGRKRRR